MSSNRRFVLCCLVQLSLCATFASAQTAPVPDKMPPLVGRLSWADPNHMTFRVVGDTPDSPGLSFSK